eukprot:2756336-Heterocapsa_arctica.AAC.1
MTAPPPPRGEHRLKPGGGETRPLPVNRGSGLLPTASPQGNEAVSMLRGTRGSAAGGTWVERAASRDTQGADA